MAKDTNTKDTPAAAAASPSQQVSQSATAANTPADKAPLTPASPAPQPLTVAEQVAKIVAALKQIGGELSLPQRQQVIEALNEHLKPAAAPPSPYKPGVNYRFSVAWGDKEPQLIEAANASEAWARACDSWRVWPSPKSGKVTCLGEVSAAAAAA